MYFVLKLLPFMNIYTWLSLLQMNLVLKLTVANLMSVRANDLSYCAGNLIIPDSEEVKSLFSISSTSCTGQTGAVNFTADSRNVTSNSYVCQPGTTLRLVNSQYFCGTD